MNDSTYLLDELAKESRMGGTGTETSAREIRRIDFGGPARTPTSTA
ncbi:hypothetical protein [Streptomyces sp. NPDC055886]